MAATKTVEQQRTKAPLMYLNTLMFQKNEAQASGD
jgi:hypothetical protein